MRQFPIIRLTIQVELDHPSEVSLLTSGLLARNSFWMRRYPATVRKDNATNRELFRDKNYLKRP